MSLQSSQQGTAAGSAAHSLSLEDISHCFSFPLSDAAAHLGVCVSVLKKICRDNGLDRWPYRKVLAGKSIEDIKKQAARERNKQQHADVAKATAPQSGSHYQNNESSKLQGSMPSHKLQQQGNKNVQIGRQHTTGLTKAIITVDEFKYGFPSNGLSVAPNRWWGSESPKGANLDGAETDEEDKHPLDNERDDVANADIVNEKKPQNGKFDSDTSSKVTGLLTTVRKRAALEGQEALKLGVYRTNGVGKLDRKQKALLFRLFGSALPNLLDGSS